MGHFNRIKSRLGFFSKKTYKKEEKKEIQLSQKIHNDFKNQKLKTPTKKELGKHLYKLTEEFDLGIKKIHKIHHELTFWGFRNEKIIEYKNESIKRRKKRMIKIKELNAKLIEQIEKNKLLEKQIEILHNKITQ